MKRLILAVAAIALVLICDSTVHAVGRNTPAVKKAFKAVVAKPSDCVTLVLLNGKQVAMGTVVTADGYILTKGSELHDREGNLSGKLTCKLKNGQSFDAKVIGWEEDHDLAMLKIETKDLKPIEFRDSKTAEVGNWVCVPGHAADPIHIGVVGVGKRSPPKRESARYAPSPDSGFLGVILQPGSDAPTIGQVQPRSAAQRAGLKVGDLVLAIGKTTVKTPEQMIGAIIKFKAGSEVTIKVKRDGKEKEIKAKLDRRPQDRGEFQNNMGSKLSSRRGGFPSILQHDAVVKPEECGSPLLDLDGKAVGINISRAGRTETYAIPAEEVQKLLPNFKAGKYVVKLAETRAMEKLEASLNAATAELKRLENEANKAEAAAKTARQALEAQKKKAADAKAALEKAKTEKK